MLQSPVVSLHGDNEQADVPVLPHQREPTGETPEPKRPKGDDVNRGPGIPDGSAAREIQDPTPLPPPP